MTLEERELLDKQMFKPWLDFMDTRLAAMEVLVGPGGLLVDQDVETQLLMLSDRLRGMASYLSGQRHLT